MANLQLKATITTIAKFEKEAKVNLVTLFNTGSVSLSIMIDMVKAFSGASDDDIDNYVAENGSAKLSEILVKELERAGFLEKSKASEK